MNEGCGREADSIRKDPKSINVDTAAALTTISAV